jgi:hypothetical protein
MLTTPNAAVSLVPKRLHYPLNMMLDVCLYSREAVPRDVKVQLCWPDPTVTSLIQRLSVEWASAVRRIERLLRVVEPRHSDSPRFNDYKTERTVTDLPAHARIGWQISRQSRGGQ